MTTRIQASLHEILSCKRQQLGQMFYDKFLSVCPEAAPFFADLNLDTQAKVLINGLQAVVACRVHAYPAVTDYLMLLGNRHHRWQIPQSLFPRFQESMLRTLADFHGSSWDAELEYQWREAFETAIEMMGRGYLVEHLKY